jgi:nucleotide-binding universal stress UspA family protein
MWDFRTIVAAVDFSEYSEEVVRVADCLARTRYTELHVIHVVASGALERAVPRAAERAAQALERLTAGHEAHLTRLVRRVLTGLPTEEIVRYATEHRAHLIVMGAHGYGPVRRLLVGSVANGVLRRAPCAVLTVPPRQQPPLPTVSDAAEMVTSWEERSRGF